MKGRTVQLNGARLARKLHALLNLGTAEEPDAILAEAAEIAADAYLGSTPAGGALLSQYLAAEEDLR